MTLSSSSGHTGVLTAEQRSTQTSDRSLLSACFVFCYAERSHGGTCTPWFCSSGTILLMYNTYDLGRKLLVLADRHRQQRRVSTEKFTGAFELDLNELNERPSVVNRGNNPPLSAFLIFFCFGGKAWPDVSAGLRPPHCWRWSTTACWERKPQPS